MDSKQSTRVAIIFSFLVLGLLGFPAKTSFLDANVSTDQRCGAFATYLKELKYSEGSSQQSFHHQLELDGEQSAVSGKYRATSVKDQIEVSYSGYISNSKKSWECSGRISIQRD